MEKNQQTIRNEIEVQMSVARVQKTNSSLMQFTVMAVMYKCALCMQYKKLMGIGSLKEIWCCTECKHAVCSHCALKSVIEDHRCPFCRKDWRKGPITFVGYNDDDEETIVPIHVQEEEEENVQVYLTPPPAPQVRERRRTALTRRMNE